MRKLLLLTIGLMVGFACANALDLKLLPETQKLSVGVDSVRSIYDENTDDAIVRKFNVKPLSDSDYGEWADYQKVDISAIRSLFVQYGFNDTQTAYDSGIVNVQRRVRVSDPSFFELKFENVLGSTDLIAYVDELTGDVCFYEQETSVPNLTGSGTYEYLHFFTTGCTLYRDGVAELYIWALISDGYGYRSNWPLILPGEWSEPTRVGRYVPETDSYSSLKLFIEKLGNPDVVWEDAIEVDKSVNLEFPNRQRLIFRKLINGKDLYIEKSSSRGEILIREKPQNLGLIMGGNYFDGTKELTCNIYGIDIYEKTHSFVLTLAFPRNDEYSVSETKTILFTEEGHEPPTSALVGSNFISSGQETATFMVSSSGEVDEWRLYVLKSMLDRQEFFKAMQGNEANVSYVVVNEENVTIQCDTLGISNTLFLAPMGIIDGKMKQAGPYSGITAYRNVPLEGEWEEWGEGKMTDVLAFPHLGYCVVGAECDDVPALSPAERQVMVERRKDAPGIIRIPDPYKGNYPYKDMMRMFDTDDIFYLVIDTTDPSRVTAERTLTGTLDGSSYGFVVFDPEYSEYGKCLDKKVVFTNNLLWDNSVPFKPYNMPQLILELPGYKDYTVTIDTIDSTGDKITVGNMSENVISVDMALVPAQEYNSYYPERMCERVINGDEDLIIQNYPVKAGESLSVEIAALARSVSRRAATLPFGRYRVVVVPRDADGNTHYGIVSDEVEYKVEWNYLGVAEINENAILIVSPLPEGGVNMTAEVYEDPLNPGFYMLKDCYKGYAEQINAWFGDNVVSEYVPNSLYIDARDPNRVNLVADAEFGQFPNSKGFNTGVFADFGSENSGYNGFQFINTMSNVLGRTDEEFFGKKEGNYISFDVNSLVTSWTETSDIYYIENFLVIKLPDNDYSGADDIVDADNSDYPVEWYNLQGIRINIGNAPSGIYIRRQGIVSEKVYHRR